MTCLACQNTNLTPVETTKAMMHPPSSTSFTFSECQDCGLVMLDPPLSLDDLKSYYGSAYFPNRGEAAWGKYGFLVANDLNKLIAERIEVIKRNFTIQPDSVILDLGCGKPAFLSTLATQHSCKAIGIDQNDDGWLMTRSLYPHIDLYAGAFDQINNLPPLDLTTAWHSLNKDPTPTKTLQLIFDKTKPGGQLIIEVPDYDSVTRKTHGAYWAGYHTPRHATVFTMASLTNLLKKIGWTIEDSYAYGSLDPYILDWTSRMEKKGIDWSENMEQEFWKYMRGKAVFETRHVFKGERSLGVLTVIAQKK